MKGAGKIIVVIGMATSCVLLYVHLNVSLFHVSYAIHEKSQELVQRSEQYRQIKYDIDRLRAPRRLEEKMKEMSLDLRLPREIEVVRVPEKAILTPESASAIEAENITGRVMNFLGRWISVAQAKTEG